MSIQKKAAAECFGKVLKSAREDAGQSQEELAKKARLNRTFISFLERGLRQPTLVTIFSIALALRTRAGKFVARVEQCFLRQKKSI